VEWVYILICKFALYNLRYEAHTKTYFVVGLQRGLEGHVPKDYAVTHAGNTGVPQASQTHYHRPADTANLYLDEQEQPRGLK
jgi:hypothetical protein